MKTGTPALLQRISSVCHSVTRREFWIQGNPLPLQLGIACIFVFAPKDYSKVLQPSLSGLLLELLPYVLLHKHVNMQGYLRISVGSVSKNPIH